MLATGEPSVAHMRVFGGLVQEREPKKLCRNTDSKTKQSIHIEHMSPAVLEHSVQSKMCTNDSAWSIGRGYFSRLS